MAKLWHFKEFQFTMKKHPTCIAVGWGGQMMTKPSTKEFKFAVRLTILGNLIIVVILIFIFIFFKVEQSKYLDIADICWV